MNTKSQHILEAALSLDEADRALIAEQLLASLTAPGGEASDDELAAELDRRLEDHHRDPTGAVPWSELKPEG